MANNTDTGAAPEDTRTIDTVLSGSPKLPTGGGAFSGDPGTVQRPADTEALGERDGKSADEKRRDMDAKRDEARKAETDAAQARIRLDEARIKAASSHKTDEQREADRLHQEADDAHARAAEARRAAGMANPRTVADARVVAPVDPNLNVGHHRAQKFGNDPENPKPAKGEHTDPQKMTVRMTLRSPDTDEPRETWVHRDMMENYARAGWEPDVTTL